MQSINKVLRRAIDSGIVSADAERLVLHAIGRGCESRAWLRANDSEPISPSHIVEFESLIRRRLDHEPMSYITGQREFYGLPLQIDRRVLDPRPDTETLVDWALEVLQGQANPNVADLGTGSGAIALAIMHQRPDAHVLAVDASEEALAVARGNAVRLKLHMEFAHGSWLEPLEEMSRLDANALGAWQIIVSNPPYIAEADEHLAGLKHEPREALTSGSDGLDAIRHIVAHAPEHLATNGWLLLEHGYNQADAVQKLLEKRGFESISYRNDLAGIARCTGGRWGGQHKAR